MDRELGESYLHSYIEGAGLAEDPKGVLFRTIGRGTGVLTRTPLPQANAYADRNLWLGARISGSGSIRTSVQRSDSGEAVAAREFGDRLGVA
jgi:hypothetical protein